MSSIFIRYPTLGGSGGGVTIYPNLASFPLSAPVGTLGVAQDSGIVYEFFGGSWQAIAALGDALSLGSPLNGLSLVANVLTIGLSSASTIGALSSADWSTFNAKQPAGSYITALTGDGTATGPGSSALTLATVATPGTFPKVTFNAKGLVTSGTTLVSGDIPDNAANTSGTASNITAISNSTLVTLSSLILPYSQLTGAPAAITALTGDVTASGPGSSAATLATVNGNVGSFGSSTSIPSFTVNGKGLVTAASGNAVIAPAGTLTGTTLASNVVTSSLTSLGTQSQALNMGSHLINSVTDPVSAQDAATKNYVDTVASGLQPIQAVSAATAGSNISGTYNNGAAGIGATFTTTSTATFTVDGYTPTLTQRILFKDQSSGFQNGVYNITQLATGILPAIFTRSLDYNTAAAINAGDLIPVINGTINSQTSWLQTANVTTIGTDALVFVQWTANPANYLLKANNLSDVSSKTTSFNNLSPMTTGGDIIYGGASGTGTRLANGSSGQVLTSSGGTSAPTWQTPTSGGMSGSDWKNDETFTFTGLGTVTLSDVWYRRVGDSMQVRGTVTAGTPSATAILINMPVSPVAYTIDSAKMTTKVRVQSVGTAHQLQTGGTNAAWDMTNATGLTVVYDGSTTTSLLISWRESTGTWEASTGVSYFAPSAILDFEFTVPITGWTFNN